MVGASAWSPDTMPSENLSITAQMKREYENAKKELEAERLKLKRMEEKVCSMAAAIKNREDMDLK